MSLVVFDTEMLIQLFSTFASIKIGLNYAIQMILSSYKA